MFAVLLASDDPGWLLAAEEAVILAGHVVVGQCPDVVSLMAQAALDVADLVVAEQGIPDMTGSLVSRLRRTGLMVVEIGPLGGSLTTARAFETLEDAFAWALAGTKHSAAVGDLKAELIAVFGCKGSPGATTFAIDLAQRIARRSAHRVGLVDLDARGGDVRTYLGLPDYPNVVTALDALSHDVSWSFTHMAGSLRVLVAPSRPGWSAEVVVSDVERLLDDLGPAIVDAGSLESAPSDLVRHLIARASCVVLVGGTSVVNSVHLGRSQSSIEQLGARVRVVTEDHAAVADELASTFALDAEQQRQVSEGVLQREDRDGEPRMRPGLFGRIRSKERVFRASSGRS